MTAPDQTQAGGLSLQNPDPFQFRKEGLAGKVIGALFVLVFILLAAMGLGGFKAMRLGEQLVVSNKSVADAVRGVSVGLYDLGQFITEEPRPRNPVRRPSEAPAAAAPAPAAPADPNE